VAVCPTLRIGAETGIRLLALVVEQGGEEAYRVCVRTSLAAPFVAGVLAHVRDDTWNLLLDGASSSTRVSWTSPDEVFALALGRDTTADGSAVTDAAPHWPVRVTDRLVKRRLSGPGTVAFDAGWFLSELATSPLDRPILLPDAAAKLGLKGLELATKILRAVAMAPADDSGACSARGLVDLLVRAVDAERPGDRALAWSGDGRLIGEFHGGELAQIGTDIEDGCRAVLGTGPLQVVFEPLEPLGLGLGPMLHTDAADSVGEAHDVDSAGAGCMVGEVDPGGVAQRAGVMPGMGLSHLCNPYLDLPAHGPDAVSFEGVLDAIDTRLSVGDPLTVTFDTAAPATHLYAVEMPAAAALVALSATVDGAPPIRSGDVERAALGERPPPGAGLAPSDATEGGPQRAERQHEPAGRGNLRSRRDRPESSRALLGAALDALCGRTLLWREDTPRLFLGEAGSVTCAHSDMCPQVQMAHALLGTKLLGVASHHATARLRAEHAPDGEDTETLERNATSAPTDRPLTARASRLLCDPELTVAVLRAGDLAVFDSGALHFASNGAEAISGALYHGLMTPGAVPRLRLAAAASSGSHTPTRGAYSGHLYAPELLRLVEQRLATASSL